MIRVKCGTCKNPENDVLIRVSGPVAINTPTTGECMACGDIRREKERKRNKRNRKRKVESISARGGAVR